MIEDVITLNFCPEDPIEDPIKSKWPAIISAINRTANVIGRIMCLIVSTNDIKRKGVPRGLNENGYH